MRNGVQLWPRAIQLPTTTTFEYNGIGNTAEEKAKAVQAARENCEKYDGAIKQFYQHWHQAVEASGLTYLSKSAKIAPGVEARFTANYGMEYLHVRSSANVSLKQTPRYRTIKPLLTTDGWQVASQSGFLNFDSALEIDDPKRFRVQFEDSENCGGPNGNTQTVTVTMVLKVIRGSWRVVLKEYDGLAELEDAGYEQLDFSYVKSPDTEPVYMLNAFSVGGKAGCAMGEPAYTPGVKEVDLKETDELTLTVYASTNDGRFHKKAFYELVLDWYPTTSDIVEPVSPE